MNRRNLLSLMAAAPAAVIPTTCAVPAIAAPTADMIVTHEGRARWTLDAARNPYADIAVQAVDRILGEGFVACGTGIHFIDFLVELRAPSFTMTTGPVFDSWSGWDEDSRGVYVAVTEDQTSIGELKPFRTDGKLAGIPKRGMRKLILTDAKLNELEKALPAQVKMDWRWMELNQAIEAVRVQAT